jgi:hypothetical protein
MRADQVQTIKTSGSKSRGLKHRLNNSTHPMAVPWSVSDVDMQYSLSSTNFGWKSETGVRLPYEVVSCRGQLDISQPTDIMETAQQASALINRTVALGRRMNWWTIYGVRTSVNTKYSYPCCTWTTQPTHHHHHHHHSLAHHHHYHHYARSCQSLCA